MRSVNKRQKLKYFILVCVTTLTAAVSANAITLYVGPGQTYTKIQDAISTATDGDVVLVAPGIYKENINFSGKKVRVMSSSDPAATIIDGNSSGSVVTFNSREQRETVLAGFTIRNGTGTKVNGLEYGLGGGILCIGSSPTIRGNIIEQNKADPATGLFGKGGGICITGGGYPEISQNMIRQNLAELGGGIFIARKNDPDEFGLTDALIVNNFIFLNMGKLGGGICIAEHSNPQIINNTIADNVAQVAGGGVWNEVYTSSPSIVNTILWGNGDDIFGALSAMVSYCNIEDGDFIGVNGNISGPPQFMGSGNYHIMLSSVCIDTGTNAAAPEIDIDGEDRPMDGDGNGTFISDIGADEICGDSNLGLLREPILALSQITISQDENNPTPITLGMGDAIIWKNEKDLSHVFISYRVAVGCGVWGPEIPLSAPGNRYLYWSWYAVDGLTPDATYEFRIRLQDCEIAPEAIYDGYFVRPTLP